jgi:hypothetical protein
MATLAIFFLSLFLFPQNVSGYGPYDNPAPVNIGSADDFLVIGKTAITGDNLSTFQGNIGVSPAGAAGLTLVTCANMTAGRMYTITAPASPSGCITTAGTLTADNAKLSAATADFDAAYLDAINQTTHPYDETAGAVNISLAGVKGRGVYNYTGATSMATGLILRGSDTDIWIFQIDGAKTQAATAQMVLQNEAGVVDGSNGPRASNIFWAINGAPSQGANSRFFGVVMSTGAISTGAGSTYIGRAFSNGAVTAATSNFYIGPDPQDTLVTVEQTITASTFSSFPSFAPLSTTGGSGLGAVSFAVATAGTAGCSIVGTSTLLYSSGGTCTVTATKANSTYYLEASSTPATFTVNTKGTTITNQGTGTYSFNVASGTLNASYYEISNTDIYGLNISNTPTISDLSNGVYALNTPSGTAITLSSSTIDADPGKQIYNIVFATTTAIAANNVTQTDGTPASYWWFREGLGNVYGETKDNDTGDPGSVRWDDSSLVITVAGTVYTDAGTTALTGGTCDGATNSVRVVVGNGSTYDGTCSAADGTYSIGGVVVVGDPTITVFLNDASGGEKATVVTKTITADITDMDLYANRVIVRHEDTEALTVADMASYDASNDSDISFVAATGTTDTLSVRPETELYVFATSTFTPGGVITLESGGSGQTYDGTLHIGPGATFTANGTTTYSVGGSFLMESGATFTAASSTVAMTATTTGKAITASAEIAFAELAFVGVGGAWNINTDISVYADMQVATGTVTGTGDIDVLTGSLFGDGTISMGAGMTTIATTNTYGGLQPWLFNDLVFGNGSVVGTTTPVSSATTTIGGVLTVSSAHYLDAGSSIWNLTGSGNVFVENGTFLEDTSTVQYGGTTNANVLNTDYYNLSVSTPSGSPTITASAVGLQVRNDLYVGGSGDTVFNLTTNDPVTSILGDVYIASDGTLVGSNVATLTVSGDWDNDGVFTSSAGLVDFDSSDTFTIAAGASSFGDVLVSATGTVTVTENATSSGSFTLAPSSDFTLDAGRTLSVGDDFNNNTAGSGTTWTGATLHLFGTGQFDINASITSDVYDTLSAETGTHIRMWNSSSTNYTTQSGGSIYSMDHMDVTGDLYIFGDYEQAGVTDYWSYETDFDGTDLAGAGRVVDVYVENAGSVTYSAGGLEILGTSTASTTVSVQSAGTYSFDISGGSFVAQQYVLQDIDSDGLTFTGTPTIDTFSNGEFIIGPDNARGITIAGSVISANPAKNLVNNIFSTTTGVTVAVNASTTGDAVSSWRFTTHSGDIDGEVFDADDGDPGYLVWDDSLALIVISGTVYENDGVTVSSVCGGSATNIVLAVDGLVTPAASSTCNGSGFYSISGVSFSPNDTLSIFIDGEIGQQGVTVSSDPISSVGNMDVYEDHLIVRHEGTDALLIADLADYDSGDDADIPFTAVDAGTDTLTLDADIKLLVWDSKEFDPQGNITTGGGVSDALDGTVELQDDATLTLANTETHSIGGDLAMGTDSIFTPAESTVTFTSAGAGRIIDTNESGFFNVVLNGSGAYTSVDTALLVAGDVMLTSGSLLLPVATTTFSGSLTTTGGSFNPNGGLVVFDSVSVGETITASGSVFNELQFAGSGAWSMNDTNATTTDSFTITDGTVTLPSGTITVGGDFRNVGGAVTHNTSELIFSTAGSASLLVSGSDLYAVSYTGGGTYLMEDTSLAVLDTLTISSGAVTFASGTLSVGGSLDAAGGTFDSATGTVLFNSSDTGESVDPGTSPFYNAVFGSGSGGWTMQSATTTNNFTLSTASTFTLASGETLLVNGVFANSVGGANTTWTGSAIELASNSIYEVNSKSAGGDTYEQLIVTGDSDISIWDSSVATLTIASSSSYYSQDNAGVTGDLYIYGDFHVAASTQYWSYARDFDGTALGGSSRAVNVYFANNATSTVDGGSLQIIGAANGSTTIQAILPSNDFAFNITSGVFNASYYEIENTDTNGLHITNTPTISGLSNGSFLLTANTGSAITITAEALNANASKIFTNVGFSASSSVTGSNVELTVATTSNAWKFAVSYGGIDGESFDSDGPDACGSIRWDDSTCLLVEQTQFRWRNNDGGLGVADSEWFDTDWGKRKRVRVTNEDAVAYSSTTAKIAVTYDADMQADFEDLRFTANDGVTEIAHWTELYNASTNAVVWLAVDTLAANESQDLYMYYSNGAATSSDSIDGVFIAGDDFEDTDISEYSGDTGLFTVDGSFAFGGSNGLDTTGFESSRADDGIKRTDQVVAQGEIIRYMQYVDLTAGSSDESCTLFGVSTSTSKNNYGVCLELFGTDRITLAKDVESTDTFGSVAVLVDASVTYTTGWYEVEVDWQTDNTIDVSLFTAAGALVATMSATDSTYTYGGYGFTYWGQNGGWDSFVSRTRTETDHSITFGGEQVQGGASWSADRNAPPGGFEFGDVARIRFAVENTGLDITGQLYQLEFADKGVAPSCEAVDTADYAIVPDTSSCGLSGLCMATSSYYTDATAIADLLEGTNGNFVSGYALQDTSNTAPSLNLSQGEYTELEYAIAPTINAASDAYCIRVTNAGTDLDSYAAVAEFAPAYYPSFGSVTFNAGADISLVAGTTTRVYATSTVTDFNGYNDIVLASSTMYTTNASALCAEDNNDCYLDTLGSQCSLINCLGNSCTLSCYADFLYHADATDTDGANDWYAFLEVEDAAGGYGFGTSPSVEVATLRALEVNNTIDYGALAVSTDTGAINASTTIANIGNDAIDIDIVGDDLDDGYSSTIVASQQIFATSTFDYATCTECTTLSTSSITYEVDLLKPTTTAPPVTDDIFWGIAIPFGAASHAHTGFNTFYATGD